MRTFKAANSLDSVVIAEVSEKNYALYMELSEEFGGGLQAIRIDNNPNPKVYTSPQAAINAAESITMLFGGGEDEMYAHGLTD